MRSHVGIYVRVSKSDQEGNSVANQIRLLKAFVAQNPNWVLREAYVDEGYSGKDFNRPRWQQMLKDIRENRIQLICVKDLSRFGRNYLAVEKYIHEIFPNLGCRFISLSEPFDSAMAESETTQILNFMNDYYLKNLSNKIKKVFVQKAKMGRWMSGIVPYGYRRKEENKLEIFPETAFIVKRLFEMRLEGNSYTQICDFLNKNEILPPSARRRMQSGKDGQKPLWYPGTVQYILTNSLYKGVMVQQKWGSVSHRSNKQVKKNPVEWIRVVDDDLAIVDSELWQKAQEIGKKRAKVLKITSGGFFGTGILYCLACGGELDQCINTYYSKNNAANTYIYYRCRKKHCPAGEQSRTVVNEKKLLVAINRALFCFLAQKGEARLARTLEQKLIKNVDTRITQCEKTRAELSIRQKQITERIKQAFEDKVTGALSPVDFQTVERDCGKQEEGIDFKILEAKEQQLCLEKIKDRIKHRQIQIDSGSINLEVVKKLGCHIRIGSRVENSGSFYQQVEIIFDR